MQPIRNRYAADMQPSLFDSPNAAVPVEDVILYALGEFQARGHTLAGRELALDRLHGAIERACLRFSIEEIQDDATASLLSGLGARVVAIPQFFAKRPFRVTIPQTLADEAAAVYRQLNGKSS